jgi:hypothetical protein
MKISINSTMGIILQMLAEILKLELPEDEEQQPDVTVPIVGDEPQNINPPDYVPPAVLEVEEEVIIPSPIIDKEEADAIREEQNDLLIVSSPTVTALPTERTLSKTYLVQ